VIYVRHREIHGGHLGVSGSGFSQLFRNFARMALRARAAGSRPCERLEGPKLSCSCLSLRYLDNRQDKRRSVSRRVEADIDFSSRREFEDPLTKISPFTAVCRPN
jgi:hypothetical protein